MEYEDDTEIDELAMQQEAMLPARYSAVVLPPRAPAMHGKPGELPAGAALVVECEDADGAQLSMRQTINRS